MQCHQGQLQTLAVRRAFTLVEMLIVGAIIVILVTMTLIATKMAINSAKETKTRATIQKLDVAVRQIFEKYEDKFRIIKKRIAQDYADPQFDETDRQRIVAHLIRDFMRMEMPQNWAEVFDSTDTNAPNMPKATLGPIPNVSDPQKPGSAAGVKVEESAVLQYYYVEYEQYVGRGGNPDTGPSRAALLFLMIQNLNPEALEAFHGSEVATGDDGFSIFVDAWGNPIQFLRWAPAFHGSDIQPNVLAQTNILTDVDWLNGYKNGDPLLQDAMASARAMYPDPTDERDGAVGWFMFPLIYSAGLDGKYGLNDENPDSPEVGVDGILDPFAFPYGMPLGGGGHFDNIHNHQRYKAH